MNGIMKGKVVKFGSIVFAVVVPLLLASGDASAKGHKTKGSETQNYVGAHLSFTGLSDIDMEMQRKLNGAYYLYIQHSQEEGISIIDISHPVHPKMVGTIPPANQTTSGTLNVMGDLAIVSESNVPSTKNNASTRNLILWDTSNPATPREVQRFAGVVRWLEDDRNFIYVLNGDGLWVLSPPEEDEPSSSY
jgi:hypothetical protein